MIAALEAAGLWASMRPGRLTPENLARHNNRAISLPICFNEAGAINPGKPCSKAFILKSELKSFNEAGAINPGKPSRQTECRKRLLRASMRPGRLTPENPCLICLVLIPVLMLQ